ncbi:acyl-CoA dehydrogenase [Amycolatopsis sp. NBRC 101858]|uniref:acyl-CoA dehydrogenase family protein n=1 Tax=Amycolatopsis sp. NBRC 101858 TaxID=3032200 RepID=UPI0024A37053|nr:acyl-CoA dehydrogenase family protein [Amycolatopsis sp. NBRC 101858]GLY38937.1 acyl-CoA dehydrogenase [Amycolatopsis sp. NBRC 101858]
MDFELNAEQLMLREASRRMLAERAPLDREHIDRGETVSVPGLWQLGVELGWTGLAVPEGYGGTGQGLTELILVAEELGRAAAPGPFVPTALVALAVSRAHGAALRAEVLPELAEGTAATWAFAEPGRAWAPEEIGTTARAVDGGFVLDGVKSVVQDAADARWLLVTALAGTETATLLVDRSAPGVSIRRHQAMDPTRTFHEVRFEGVLVPAERLVDSGADASRRLLDDASILTAADALGVMERLLTLTVDHVSARVQFGRPIGSFQAVKQACASMAMDVQATRAATYYAAMAADAGAPDAARAACAAASQAGSAARRVAGHALQLHGGIGFTWEHDLHLYLRRAMVDAALHGDPAQHDERLCGLLLAG